ncbi:hypothetical protein AHiyo4_29370 [Arthrobacter sp. Hiyo4]|nr:hypothetical protein AHiyo4_29370 [Arthrobacter sp. Hiyo4]
MVLQKLHDDGGHVRVPDHYRFGGVAQRRGNCRFTTRLNSEARGKRAHNAIQPGVEGVRRTVFSVKAELQCVTSGHEGVTLADSFSPCGGQIGNLLDDGVELCAGALVVGVEAFLPLLDPRHLGFEGGELRLGPAAAFLAGGE